MAWIKTTNTYNVLIILLSFFKMPLDSAPFCRYSILLTPASNTPRSSWELNWWKSHLESSSFTSSSTIKASFKWSPYTLLIPWKGAKETALLLIQDIFFILLTFYLVLSNFLLLFGFIVVSFIKFSLSLLGCLPCWGLWVLDVWLSQLGFAVWNIIIVISRYNALFLCRSC